MQEFLYRLQLVRKDMLRTGPTESEQAVVAEHFAYLQSLNAQGVIIFVGRTLNPDENAMGLAVFRAESEDAARRIMDNDPVVKKGVMTATLYPFKVVLQGK
ncbi:MAG: YciI family protein [Acidobacteriia bacterium]|nr:YciI family protein [Terriglobia bacterium]